MKKHFPPIVYVEDDGLTIGPISYEVAHAQTNDSNIGFRHLTANTFVFEDSKYERILLTKRSMGIHRQGVLNVCVGGHAIWSEELRRAQTPNETASAELNEELFHEVSPPQLSLEAVCSFKKNLKKEDPEYVHLFKTIHSGPFFPNPLEVSETFFARIDHIKRDVENSPDIYVSSARLYLDRLLHTLLA
ncbi:NUDIX domain-containing protein [Candidatus Pacearchaeota archaeon]|nr:NUDIX domain-containing protein [Candidatus Pacearchaeota archaeon]